MPRVFLCLTCLGTLLLSAHAANSQPSPGLALRWNRCYGEGGAPIRSFACNTNSGVEQLIGSFVVPGDMSNVVGNEIIVQVTTGYPFWPYPSPTVPLPEWWRFKNPGACRQNAVSFSTVKDPALSGCEDWAYGQAAGGIGAYTID